MTITDISAHQFIGICRDKPYPPWPTQAESDAAPSHYHSSTARQGWIILRGNIMALQWREAYAYHLRQRQATMGDFYWSLSIRLHGPRLPSAVPTVSVY